MHFVQSRCCAPLSHIGATQLGCLLFSLLQLYCCPIVLFSFTQSTHNYLLFKHPTSVIQAVPLHILIDGIVAWLVHTGTFRTQKRHWKSLFSRLICPLIHLSSSTSSVLTCPPPKDPLHASSPPQPAPRRRLLLPLFFQSSSSPPFSSFLFLLSFHS